MGRAQHVAETQLVREVDLGADGRWLVERHAPGIVALLQDAPDAADLSRLVGLVFQGIAQVARERYEGLTPHLAGQSGQ